MNGLEIIKAECLAHAEHLQRTILTGVCTPEEYKTLTVQRATYVEIARRADGFITGEETE